MFFRKAYAIGLTSPGHEVIMHYSRAKAMKWRHIECLRTSVSLRGVPRLIGMGGLDALLADAANGQGAYRVSTTRVGCNHFGWVLIPLPDEWKVPTTI